MFVALTHFMSACIGLGVHNNWGFATALDQDGRVAVQRQTANMLVPGFLENFVLKVGLEASTRIAALRRLW